MNTETHYIQQYLAPLYTQSSTYPLKIGDDCAVIDAKNKILTSVDSSVEEQHFPKDLNPYHVAYRAVAVAISDIYAMGGIPESYLLSISNPQPSDLWFEEFSKGIKKVNQLLNQISESDISSASDGRPASNKTNGRTSVCMTSKHDGKIFHEKKAGRSLLIVRE